MNEVMLLLHAQGMTDLCLDEPAHLLKVEMARMEMIKEEDI